MDLTSNQTVGGNKEFTGTTTAHDVIPSATETYNFGSSTAQWNNAYIKSLTINGVACGDILTHNVSEFVDVSSNQTVNGIKTFSTGGCIFFKQIKINHNLEYGKNNPPSQSAYHNLMFTDASGWWGSFIENVTDTNGNSILAFYVRNTNEIQSRVYLKCGIDGSFSMYPLSNNVWNLGTSTNKWKSFNSVEPSGLSLPSDTSINIDTTGFAWGANFTFTPSVNGYLFISIPDSTGTRKLSLKTGRGEYYFSNQTGILRFTMPVYKGKIVTIFASSTVAETVIPNLSLFPCQGNV